MLEFFDRIGAGLAQQNRRRARIHQPGMVYAIALSAALCAAAAHAQSPGADGFEVMRHQRTVDLSGWRQVTEEQRQAKTSPVIWHDRMLDAVYWNGLRNSAVGVVGIPVQFKTRSVSLEVVSPNRKFRSYSRMAFELRADSEKETIDDENAAMTVDQTSIVWRVGNVRQNWVYAIRWEW